MSRKRVNNLLACLGKILRYAHEAEIIASVPKIRLLKLDPPKFDVSTFEELERLLEAVKDDPERRALLLGGGHRPGDRCAPASSWRAGLLPRGWESLHAVSEAALRYACKRAGLRQIGSHLLRHTFCSHLAMRGAAPKAIQELAGHSTLTMTMRYVHLAPAALRQAIELLNTSPENLGQRMDNTTKVAS